MTKLIILVLLVINPLTAYTATSYSLQNELTKWKSSSGSKVQRLDAFYKLYWDYLLNTYPEMSTYRGIPGRNDQWSDHSLAATEKSKKNTLAILTAIKSISERGLKNEDLMNYRLFLYKMEEDVAGFKYPSEYLIINQMGGTHSSISQIFTVAPKNTLKDYQDILSRLKAVPDLLDQDLLILQEGLKKGITPPQVTLSGLAAQFDALTNTQLEDNPIFEVFKDIKVEAAKPLQAEAREVMLKKVIPALNKMKDFLVKDYIPGCRQQIGWFTLPNGKNWYNSMIKDHTTLDLTADEIFQLGENEVARIQKEMGKIRDQLQFKGDAQKFHASLNDSRFQHKTAEDLVNGYRSLGKLIDAELPRLFKKLPRLPYGMKEMPPYMGPTGPGAYFEDGDIKASRPGYFFINTYDLKSRLKWEMLDLTCHEAVPGHHLQLAIAREMEDVPEFRRNMHFTSYIEGWALYAEILCDELGLYKDPYDKYGHLAAELYRAVRLVVDTGIHAKGWSRDQVVKYFREAGPFSESDVQSETNRYINWPGQALGYKIGQLKIKEIREKLSQRLGDRFDVRDFHDAILGSGTLPLPVLEKKMDEWALKQEKNPKTIK